MIARGWLFPDAGDLLKELYVDVCASDFRLDGKRLTDSRISVLTGLQRKDVRAIRARLEEAPADAPAGAGPVPRVVAHWISGPPYSTRAGKPKRLPRTAEGKGPSFESLVSDVSRDIHARTILDELKRQDLVLHDEDKDRLELLEAAYVPSADDESLLGYFGANVGDHAEAASANIAAAPDPGPFFERAVHYNQLTPEALAELQQLAGKLHTGALSELNTAALTLQKRDAGDEGATCRFRSGAYFYGTPVKATGEES